MNDRVATLLQVGIDGRTLPTLRRIAGLSQAELAKRLGVQACEVSRLESSLRPVDGLLDRAIAIVLDAANQRWTPAPQS